MPSDTVIKVENLSKRYRIGEHQGYKTFREAIVDAGKAPFRTFRKNNSQSEIHNSQSNTIWALKDVSFEVKRGEVIGIIGRNGAGKSTLLKILSKITEPTSGKIQMKGRIGSLLEVGTGFHPELTGHENVYMYGAILGMDRWEVTRKFDEIVAFAELEKFINTPVKRYSSGMYMRLAFAVAAHLDPEILLVDEVLAVGDFAFQKKCLGKMEDVSRKGRTILFVSHNLDSVQRLCNSCLLLEEGRIITRGRPKYVINDYIKPDHSLDAEWINSAPDLSAKGYLDRLRVLDSQGRPKIVFHRDETVHIEMSVVLNVSSTSWVFRLDIVKDGFTVFRTSDFDSIPQSEILPGKSSGRSRFRVVIPAFLLNFGSYAVKPHFGLYDIESVYFQDRPLIGFSIQKEVQCNNFVARLAESRHPGFIFPRLRWYVDD